MGSTNEGPDVASPRIFAPSSLNIDDSQLCFNKNHFGRADFDVQRFMNLARRRAGLEQIQKDLRLYLKSVQHSMIELINDDYADFVHLSSNLVSLQSAIDKIDKDLQAIWTEFETNTGEAVGTAQQIEMRCELLTTNRRAQSDLRDRIAFISGLQILDNLLRNIPSTPTVLWLEKVASCVVDITSYAHSELVEDSREHKAYQKILKSLEKSMCNEGVRSANSDCSTLPLVLSVLSLTQSTSSLTAALVAQLLHPQLVTDEKNQYKLLVSVYDGVNKMRSKWETVLGSRFSGNIRTFLDQTLLTFLHTFIDKCLGMVAVPSDTRLFHRCFVATQSFIQQWPTASSCRLLLKAIRDKFNLVVYFKLETHKLIRQIDGDLDPDAFALSESPHDDDEPPLYCRLSQSVASAIDKMWSDEVYLPPLIDKLWDFNLRMLSKHLSWTRAMIQNVAVDGHDVPSMTGWQCLLKVRTDASNLHSRVFNLALELIWTRLRDLDVDTSPFGQCLTRLGSMIDSECAAIDRHLVEMIAKSMKQEMDSVTDVPKQYRWTKKPLPTTHSAYVPAALEHLKSFETEMEIHEVPNAGSHKTAIISSVFAHFVSKAKEVLDSVDATGSSLSRFKRKGAVQDGASDDDKIRAQIYRDALFCLEESARLDVSIAGLRDLVDRSRPDPSVQSAGSENERSTTPVTSCTASDTNGNSNKDEIAVQQGDITTFEEESVGAFDLKIDAGDRDVLQTGLDV